MNKGLAGDCNAGVIKRVVVVEEKFGKVGVSDEFEFRLFGF